MKSATLLLVLLAACGEPATAPGAVDTLSDKDASVTQQFAEAADAVFVGTVTGLDHQVSEADAEGRQLPFTYVTWQVDHGVKGVRTGQRYTARFLGGPMGDAHLHVTEIPEFEVGDTDLLFVRGNGRVGSPLVGGPRGRVQIVDAGDPVEGLSPAASPRWLKRVREHLAAADHTDARAATSVVLGEPFTFAWPERPSHEALAAAEARNAPVELAQPPMSAASRAEHDAIDANGRNPVLPL
jgi:hypothetical protein